MGAIRRAYVYAVALVSLGVMAASVDSLLAWAGYGAFGGANRADAPLLSIAGVIVQLPIWVIHWVIAQSSAKRDPEDRGATIRRLYLVLAIAGAVGAAAVGVAVVVRAGIREQGVDAIDGLAAILTATPILLVHRHALIEDRTSGETRTSALIRRIYLALLATVAALVALSSGSGLVTVILETLFGLNADVDVPRVPMVAEMSGALVAASFVWATHHRGDIIAVTGSLETDDFGAERHSFLPALYRVLVLTIATAVTLGNVTALLDWMASQAIGPIAPPDVAVDAFASLVTYAAAWWAFRRTLIQDLGDGSADASKWVATLSRVHRYVVTVIALAVAAVGIAQIVGILLDIVAGSTPESGSYVRDLRFWVAATVTGLPTWVAFWRPPGHPRLDLVEIASKPRRGALYVVVFACAVSLLTAGVWVTYGLLGMALGKPFDFPIVALSASGVATVIGAYQLSVLRAESRILVAQAPTPLPRVGSTEPSAQAPWAVIWATSNGASVSWHATADEARTISAPAGAHWHVVARLDVVEASAQGEPLAG